MVRRTLAATSLIALAALCASVAPAHAQTPPPNTCGDETFFWFVYDDGAVDTGCAEKNDVTPADIPGLVANSLHVSCSDRFPGGVPEKSDLGGRLVVQFFISKDGGKKTCGALPPPPQKPPELKVKKRASATYVHQYGIVTFTITVENIGGGVAKHVVLQDHLAPGFIFVGATFPACSYNAFAHSVTCNVGDLPGGGSAVPTSNPCPGKQTYFRFQYSDGLTDEGCASKNDVTPAEVPGLVASKLHVSCSDTFTNGVPKKSVIGNRRVDAYLIIKGDGKKTCGEGTFRPPKKTFEIRVKVKKHGCNVAKAVMKHDWHYVYSNEVCVKVKSYGHPW